MRYAMSKICNQKKSSFSFCLFSGKFRSTNFGWSAAVCDREHGMSDKRLKIGSKNIDLHHYDFGAGRHSATRAHDSISGNAYP